MENVLHRCVLWANMAFVVLVVDVVCTFSDDDDALEFDGKVAMAEPQIAGEQVKFDRFCSV